jgi:hypothetical protein
VRRSQRLAELLPQQLLLYKTNRILIYLTDFRFERTITKWNTRGIMPTWIPLTCYTVVALGTLSNLVWKIVKTIGFLKLQK